jgi:hypothetical protein
MCQGNVQSRKQWESAQVPIFRQEHDKFISIISITHISSPIPTARSAGAGYNGTGGEYFELCGTFTFPNKKVPGEVVMIFDKGKFVTRII